MTKQCPSCGGDCGRTAKSGCMYGTKPEKPAHTDHPMRHHDRTCPACQKDDVEPVAYLAWRDGKPCWDEDCVCQDAVYPVDEDDDRTSMPVYTHPVKQPMTDSEIDDALSDIWGSDTGETLSAHLQRKIARAIESRMNRV